MPNPNLAFTYPDGLPEFLNPAGDSIRVVVSGKNEGMPEPGTGMVYYDIGSGFVAAVMD